MPPSSIYSLLWGESYPRVSPRPQEPRSLAADGEAPPVRDAESKMTAYPTGKDEHIGLDSGSKEDKTRIFLETLMRK